MLELIEKTDFYVSEILYNRRSDFDSEKILLSTKRTYEVISPIAVETSETYSTRLFFPLKGMRMDGSVYDKCKKRKENALTNQLDAPIK
jgi:hypothetical protein